MDKKALEFYRKEIAEHTADDGSMTGPWVFLNSAVDEVERCQSALNVIKTSSSKGQMRRIAIQALGKHE